MEHHSLADLLQDVAALICRTGMKLELITDHYLTHKLPIIASNQNHLYQQEQLFQNVAAFENNLDVESSSSCEQQPVKKSAFSYYLKQKKQKIKEQFPHYSPHQIIAKAAADFKELPQLQKMSYLRLFMKSVRNQRDKESCFNKPSEYAQYSAEQNTKKIVLTEQPFLTSSSSFTKDNGFGMVSLFDHRDNYPKSIHSSFNLNNFEEARAKDIALDQFKQENLEDSMNQKRMAPTQITFTKNDKDDSKGKGDIYRQALHRKSGERQQKGQPKGQQTKQKSQFQTLKSLFKKLQNTT